MSADHEPDLILKADLDRLVTPLTPAGTWSDVEQRARRKRRRRRGARALAAAVVVVAAGYGGYTLWHTLSPEPTVLVIADSAPENLGGVKAELWAEIERVKEQSEAGDLAWTDILQTWEAMGSVYPGAGGPDLDPESWVSFLDLLEQPLLAETPGPHVCVYLKDEAAPEDVSALQADIMARPEVESVVYASKEEALERLKEWFADDNPEVLEGLTGNPLPASLEIHLVEGDQAASFAAGLAGRPEIDQMKYAGFEYEAMLALLRGLTPAGVSTTAPLISTSTTWGTAPMRLPAFALEDVAFVELERSRGVRGDANDRRILSPALDAAEIQALLDGYVAATGLPASEFVGSLGDLVVTVHFLEGRALNSVWTAEETPRGLVEYEDCESTARIESFDAYSPAWSYQVLAPELLATAEAIMAEVPDGETATSLPGSMPEDFGFIGAFDVYGKCVVDTFEGAYYQDMVLPRGTTATARVTLTRAQLEELYAGLVELDVLSCDRDYVPDAADMMVTPNEAYYLRFKAGSIEKEIRWNDETLSEDPRAMALRDWFDGLRDLIDASPECQALPAIRGGYD